MCVSERPEAPPTAWPVERMSAGIREDVPVRYRARVEYDGTDFAGFQAQLGARTVQGELEVALAKLSGGNRIRVDAAGRTDAGVHRSEERRVGKGCRRRW